MIMKKFLLAAAATLLTICWSSAEEVRRGAVCFTFDDFGGENWVKANAVFKKYDARATFLVYKDITAEKARIMKELQKFGHTVGLHGLNHLNAAPLPENFTMQKYFDTEIKPQLAACRKFGIKVDCFAYPNNRHSAESDQFLLQYFNYLRAGWPKGETVFIPLDKISSKMVLPGGGIGLYYKRSAAELKELLLQAQQKNALIVFFSHNIEPGAKHVHMPLELLEELLAYARKLNMHIIGFNELDKLSKGNAL